MHNSNQVSRHPTRYLCYNIYFPQVHATDLPPPLTFTTTAASTVCAVTCHVVQRHRPARSSTNCQMKLSSVYVVVTLQGVPINSLSWNRHAPASVFVASRVVPRNIHSKTLAPNPTVLLEPLACIKATAQISAKRGSSSLQLRPREKHLQNVAIAILCATISVLPSSCFASQGIPVPSLKASLVCAVKCAV